MRIRLVSSSSGSRGGGEFYLHSLAVGLRNLGHDVDTFMSTDCSMDGLAERFSKDDLRVNRWEYRNTYRRPLRSIEAAFAKRDIKSITQTLKDPSVDIIHINQQCVEDGLDLIQAAASVDTPAVSTVHVTRSMTDLKAIGGSIRDFVARRVLSNCDVDLIGISNISASDLVRFLGLHDGRVHAVPNGVQTPLADNRSALREEWSVPEGAFVLGCVARIESQKNPLFVPKLMSKLPENVHFVWIGDGRLRETLEDEIERYQLDHRIHLDGWRATASSRMAGFDVFVLPSLYEGLPLALLEAMALGLPCIASDVDGNRDAITHDTTGFLCKVNDETRWSAVLQKLIDSPAERQRVGNASQRCHQEQFSLQAMAERTVEVYEKVISG